MAIIYEKKDHIAIITINRPHAMNAMDLDASKEMVDAWGDFRDDPDMRVGVLTGAGDRAFCAGADLKRVGEFYSLTPFERREKSENEPGLGGITRNLCLWKPIIAAINGVCFAGGLEIALACDLRIASENAQFGLLELKWGIIPGAGGTQRLPRLVPFTKALEMVLMAEKINAREAYRIGLINRVLPSSKLMPTAIEMAEKICENAPLAVKAAKEAMYRGINMPIEEALRLEQFLAEPIRQSEDAKEGIKAFQEKREPNFRGR